MKTGQKDCRLCPEPTPKTAKPSIYMVLTGDLLRASSMQ